MKFCTSETVHVLSQIVTAVGESASPADFMTTAASALIAIHAVLLAAAAVESLYANFSADEAAHHPRSAFLAATSDIVRPPSLVPSAKADNVLNSATISTATWLRVAM